MLARATQDTAQFEAGNPAAGYYNDLRGVALTYDNPMHALGWLDVLFRRREYLNPVSIVQLGLGAWQLLEEDPAWRPVVERVALFLVLDMEANGGLAYRFPMPHTYELEVPWYSAMAQGQAASLLVRSAVLLDRDDLYVEAGRACRMLLDADSPLVSQSDDGPVLQEYPTEQPAHVLNGWVFALWGLHDLAVAEGAPAELRSEAKDAFEAGLDALEARLPLYETSAGWTRYDLYPHPIRHMASPFYHRLHIAQMEALHGLTGRQAFADASGRWLSAALRRRTVAGAVARKIGFRLLRPRGKAA